MDYEPGALQSHRPNTLRTAEKTSECVSRRSGYYEPVKGPARGVSTAGGVATRAGGAATSDARRTASHRNRLLLRIDLSGNGGEVESPRRHCEDANPVRILQTSASARNELEEGRMNS